MIPKISLTLLGFFIGVFLVQAQELEDKKISIEVSEIERLRLRNIILEAEKLQLELENIVIERAQLILQINTIIANLYSTREITQEEYGINLETIVFFKLEPQLR
jgi:hypothetical protein